eukprot:scaffold123934_cov28-Prasinocladus_malaysianus.AAC.1
MHYGQLIRLPNKPLHGVHETHRRLQTIRLPWHTVRQECVVLYFDYLVSGSYDAIVAQIGMTRITTRASSTPSRKGGSPRWSRTSGCPAAWPATATTSSRRRTCRSPAAPTDAYKDRIVMWKVCGALTEATRKLNMDSTRTIMSD